jgi:hypothetical protein
MTLRFERAFGSQSGVKKWSILCIGGVCQLVR